MVTEAIKLKKLDLKMQREKLLHDIGIELARSPAFQIVATFVLVETLQRYPSDHPIMGELAGSFLEGGLLTIGAFQALAPVLPQLTEGLASVLGIAKLLPAAAA